MIEKSKSYFWVLLNTVLVLTIIFGVIGITAFYNVTRGIDTYQRTFPVTGEGEVQTAPDLATLSFATVIERATAAAAQQDSDKRMNDVIAYLKGQDIAKEDIKTSGYNLYPRRNYNRQTGDSEIVGYTLSQNVTVKIRDLDAVGDIVGGLTDLGINQISGVQFTVEDQDAALEAAREEAIEDAKRKAESLAEKTGIRLGKIVDVQEGGGYYPMPYQDDMVRSTMGMGGAVMESAKAPTIEPGTNDIRVNITLIYEVK